MIYTYAEMKEWNQNATKPELFPPVIVTKDGYILDGYHRIQRAQMLGIKISAIVLDATIQQLDPNTLRAYWREQESI